MDLLKQCRLVFVLLVLGVPVESRAETATKQGITMEDQKAVKAAVDQWFVVLNAMLNGDPAPFAAIYSHADDVSYMSAEGTYRIGWEATYADWKLQAEKAKGGKLEGSDIHIVIGGDMATAQHYTKGSVADANGQMKESAVRETSVFRKEGGDWKMISHHADDFTLWEKVVDKE
jgi:uncharacterized protein (TIGR02246 family)